MQCFFPAIDPVATGRNIVHLRKERGLSVRDLQSFFHFDEPRAIYKWQTGQSLPSIDNLYALSALLGVPMDRILVGNAHEHEERGAFRSPPDPPSGDFLFARFLPGEAFRKGKNYRNYAETPFFCVLA